MTEPSFQPVPGCDAGSTGGPASCPASIGGVRNAPSGRAEPDAGLTSQRLHNSVARQDWRLSAAADEPLLFRVLEDAYDLGHWRAWHRVKRGTSNLSWFVSTDAGDVVLRRSHNLKTVAGAPAVRSFCRQDPVDGPGDNIDKDLCRTFLRHYRSHTPPADTDLAALPEVFQAHRLIIAKKCNNLLASRRSHPGSPRTPTVSRGC
jgi:hypothetical protein